MKDEQSKRSTYEEGREMNTYYIVRHGKTQWNMLKKTQGKMDSPLTKEGIQAAELLREKIKTLSIDRVYSSDLKRATDTAKILMPQTDIRPMEGFREIDFGVWEGKTIDEIKTQYADLHDRWRRSPEEVQFIGGESMVQAMERVHKAFWAIDAKEEDQNILIVAHGMIIKLLLVSLLEAPMVKMFHLLQNNLAMNVIRTKDQAADIVTINDTSVFEKRK